MAHPVQKEHSQSMGLNVNPAGGARARVVHDRTGVVPGTVLKLRDMKPDKVVQTSPASFPVQ